MNSPVIGSTLFVADSLETEEMRKNLAACRPTFMCSVPRLWEKLYIQIAQGIAAAPPSRQKLVNRAFKVGKKAFMARASNKPVPFVLSLPDRLAQKLFKGVKTKAGLERLRYSSTGGASIDPKNIEFFGGMGIQIFQGYGLTETAPSVTANYPGKNKVGTVGPPLPGVELKIAEDGEILARGGQIMKGYRNNEEATREVLFDGGWFATGDIGEIDADGFLKITDRKKELMKTSGGKYVAPQSIENEFNTDPYIEMVSIVGEGRKYVSALVVLDFPNVRKWLQDKHGLEISDDAELANHEKVKELVAERIELVNRKLARYETIKKFAILPRGFSEETGELTPSQKKKRRVIETRYRDLIAAMYPGE